MAKRRIFNAADGGRADEPGVKAMLTPFAGAATVCAVIGAPLPCDGAAAVRSESLVSAA